MKAAHLRLLGALLSGCLVALCFPGQGFPYLSAGFLMPVAFVPLFLALENLRVQGGASHRRRGPGRPSWGSTSRVPRVLEAAGLIWITGIVIVSVAFFWCTYPAVLFGGIPEPAAYPAFGLYAVLSGTFFVVIFSPVLMGLSVGPKSGQSALPIVALAAAVTGFEIWTPRFFQWSLGSLMHNSIALSQIAAVLGFHGLTLPIMISNLSLARSMTDRGQRPFAAFLRLALIALMWLCCWAWGSMRIDRLSAGFDNGRVTRVGLVQPNFTFDELSSQPKRSAEAQDQSLDNLLDRTEQLIEVSRGELDLIVWPESVAPAAFADSTTQLDRTKDLSQSTGIPILVQASEFDMNEVREQGYRRATIYSTSFLLRPDRSRSPSYRKWVPIPFGETVPFEDRFPALGDWVRDHIGNTSKVGRGTSYAALPYSPQDYVAPLICFDAIEAELPRLQTRYGGATILVNQSNFVWMGRSTAGYQFKELVRLRAIENARGAVLAANTGPSVVFDPAGRELTPTSKIFEAGFLHASVPVSSESTPFSIWGNGPLHVFGASGLIVVLARLAGWGRRHPQRRPGLYS